MNLDDYKKAGQELYHKLHLPSYPVAIRYIKSENEAPENAIRPSASGQKWSLCQAFTYARRWGWHSAMTSDDNFCVPSSAMHKWVDVSGDDFIESQVQQGWHKSREAEKNRYNFSQLLFAGEQGEERLKTAKEYTGFICSPLTDAIVEPHSILVYGDGSHINHIVQALCYDYTFPVTSSFEGFGESCVKGGFIPFIMGRPQVVIPGMGDRSLSGTFDHEIAIGFPASLLGTVLEYLFKTGGPRNVGLPVKTLLPMGLTESITPGFSYLRKKIDESKS